jgi:hypothetical protein
LLGFLAAEEPLEREKRVSSLLPRPLPSLIDFPVMIEGVEVAVA